MNKNDDAIKSLLAVVDSQEGSLGKKKRKPLNTNGVFKYKDGEWFNINTVSDIGKLVSAMAFLIGKETAFNEACNRLGVESYFEWGGYSIIDWEADFKARIEIIQHEEKKSSLKATKKKLDSLISSDGKTAMEIEAIKKALGL